MIPTCPLPTVRAPQGAYQPATCLTRAWPGHRCLDPIWTSKTETASRLRQRIETVLDWAKVHGYRGGDNPAAWKGHLQAVMPAPQKITKVENLAALP